MNTDNLKSLAKTACDGLLAFFLALIDAVAADDAPPVVTDPQPPADDAPNDPNGDQPSDSPPPQDQNQGSADAPPAEAEGQGDAQTPAPGPTDLGTFTIVPPSQTAPEKDGSNAKVITVPDGYSVIQCWPMNNPTLTEIDADHMRYADQHATGQSFVFAKTSTVFLGKGQVYPPLPAGSTPTPPQTGTGGTTPPPPPPAPVEPTPMPPVATGPAEPGEAKDPAKLKAVITPSGGAAMTFLGSDAKDLGDFVVPAYGINQRNLSVTSPDGLWTVFFRPDRDNARVEAVVLYGDPFLPNPATFDQPYAFDLFYDGAQIAHDDVAKHFWLARWRWKSSPRPRMRTPEQLVAAKLTPNYGRTPVTTSRLPAASISYIPMGISSVTPFMGQTGERGDIGLNTEVASAYMGTGDAVAYQSMMDQAEASATGPWHLNEDDKILCWDDHPLATTYATSFSNPPIYVTKTDKKYPADFLQPDDAHHPCLSYLPFLSTGDPFHAEELQYQINFYLGGEHYDGSGLDPARKAAGGKLYIFDLAQTRGFAWMLRSVVFCYRTSSLISSPTLLPKAFWKKVLDANAKYFTDAYLNSTDPHVQRFFTAVSSKAMGWWQEDYLIPPIAEAAKDDPANWSPILAWKIQSDEARIDGKSGWPANHPTLYFTQWYRQTFSAATGNAGNGSIEATGLFDYQEKIIKGGMPKMGAFKGTFTSDTAFDLTTPDGKKDGSGTVGTPYVSGYGPHFLISAGDKPFVAGDSFIISLTICTDWADMADVNGVTANADGSLDPGQSEAYLGSLYAALAAADSSLLAGYEAKLQAANYQISWRNSLAA